MRNACVCDTGPPQTADETPTAIVRDNKQAEPPGNLSLARADYSGNTLIGAIQGFHEYFLSYITCYFALGLQQPDDMAETFYIN